MTIMKIRSQAKGEQGFTLLEMIVVIVIIGFLAGVAVPAFAGVLASSKESVDKANLNILNNACDLYEAETGETIDDLEKLKEKNYLKEIPKRPGTEIEYQLIDLKRGGVEDGDGQ